MVAHTCNQSTWEAEAGGSSWIEDQPGLHSESKDNLCNSETLSQKAGGSSRLPHEHKVPSSIPSTEKKKATFIVGRKGSRSHFLVTILKGKTHWNENATFCFHFVLNQITSFCEFYNVVVLLWRHGLTLAQAAPSAPSSCPSLPGARATGLIPTRVNLLSSPGKLSTYCRFSAYVGFDNCYIHDIKRSFANFSISL